MTIKVSKPIVLNTFFDRIKSSKKTLNVGFLNAKNAAKAAKNEYGGVFPASEEYKARGKAKGVDVPDLLNIPPRPFMQNTFTDNEIKWGKVFSQAAQQSNFDIEKSLITLGKQIKADVRETIEEGDFISNSAQTIEIKGKDSPLIDTGEMVNSIDWEVV